MELIESEVDSLMRWETAWMPSMPDQTVERALNG